MSNSTEHTHSGGFADLSVRIGHCERVCRGFASPFCGFKRCEHVGFCHCPLRSYRIVPRNLIIYSSICSKPQSRTSPDEAQLQARAMNLCRVIFPLSTSFVLLQLLQGFVISIQLAHLLHNKCPSAPLHCRIPSHALPVQLPNAGAAA